MRREADFGFLVSLIQLHRMETKVGAADRGFLGRKRAWESKARCAVAAGHSPHSRPVPSRIDEPVSRKDGHGQHTEVQRWQQKCGLESM